MLIPAITRKTEIEENFKRLFYSDDMFYEAGGMFNHVPNIQNEPDSGCFQYAVVDSTQTLIGYFAYTVDWYSSCAYNFGLISFVKGTSIIGKDVYAELRRLIDIYHLHRIEWRMVGGNPVERHYDKFCRRFGGMKHVLRDVFKDRLGNYRNLLIYEILLSSNQTSDAV